MSDLNTEKCPRCGATLPSDMPGRLCVKCVFVDVQEFGGNDLKRGEHGDSKRSKPSDDAVIYKKGDKIDHFRIVKTIDEGGSSVVYLAEQLDLNNRQVALKVIKLGKDNSKCVKDLFEAEIKALTRLDHTSIAKVYEPGTTKDACPYFTMELVRGYNITDFADNQRLTLPQRLDLFIKVCKAIKHAHLKGIIHRDIKPANILVVEEDEEPLPKIIDFNIAKTMPSRPPSDENVIVAQERYIGTPEYMSPEQAGLGNLEIDSRTDIYSLGVVLYEILTGHLPIWLNGLSKGQQYKAIREDKPPYPSARLKLLGENELLNLAHLRRIVPSGLRQFFNCELDRIVMKCLEKNRDSRYETVDSLAADIQYVLGSQNVGAVADAMVNTVIDPGPKNPNRNAMIAFLLLSIVALVCIGIGLSFSSSGSNSKPEVLKTNDISTPDAIIITTLNTLDRK